MTRTTKRIHEYLTRNPVAVLATSDLRGRPHAAVIHFVVDPDLTVYFITKERTTKARNIEQNAVVALAVYSAVEQSTVQITGEVEPIDDLSRIEEVYRRLLSTVAVTSDSAIPPLSKISGGRYRTYRLKPKTARLGRFSQPPNDDLFDEIHRQDAGEDRGPFN